MAGKNQGEGDRRSAGRYNAEQQKFVKSGKVQKAAKQAVENFDKDDLDAEAKAKARAKEFDPEEERDYTKPTE